MPTPHTPAFLYSFKRSAIFYAAMFIAILVSVNFIDRELADFIYQHSFANSLIKLLSNTPLFLEILSAIAVALCIVPKLRHQYRWLAINLAATFILASILRVSAKALFGRTWPQTWVNSNPSWISDRIEGFHPFAEGLAYNSFPSGHALFTFALATTFWYHLPRYRLLWIATMCAVFIGQLGQNYHYLGDLLAGATLGTFIAHMVIIVTEKASSRSCRPRLF
ncbi:phosphatase PAP2 family protein [Shewanella canadensis]|uniref:Phosphatase PAP2 family protein n=1 Tax=Shewanella canadensis TaxID=271096 RepID=A0A3S0RV98_9GAMM|nr:phosphatase PAP2 family protein [Shewanella canadensis]RTR37083.1 phosphatase PAP2 family protein [Shewanella canadensis]